MAESRVKAMKTTLSHMLASTIINTRPTINYASLAVVLTRAASIVNDQPIGLRSLTNYDMVPITPNQLLLGRTGTVDLVPKEEEVVSYGKCSRYQEELLDTWWAMWKVQVFPHLIAYPNYKAAKRHKNLQVGDVCLLKYDGKIRGTFRLCQVIEVWKDDQGLVRTVQVGYRPRRKEESLPYKAVKLEVLKVGVQRLVLILAKEDLPKNDRGWD